MADPVRLWDMSKMVEYDRRRHFLENWHDLHDRGRRGVDLDMPAKLVDPLCQRLNHFGRRRPGLCQVETDAARTEPLHARHLGVRDRCRDNDNGASAWAEC